MPLSAVRIVVGEGHPARKGLLRFVLEGDGYDVVGSATTSAELARVLATEQPDVVVMDDGIGATAVQMAREVAPAAKIVLVWPGAVVPIGGDARVEPAQVLRQLGTTVAQVTQPIATVTTLRQPEWVEKVRKDPSSLRERLAAKGGVPTTRPSITELQRRGQRLHPAAARAAEPGPETEPREEPVPTPAAVAPIVVLPVDAGEPTLVLPDDPARDDDVAAVAGVATVASLATAAAVKKARRVDDPGRTELNRRLGVIALSGAAVIGAAALSLALSGTRVSPTIVAYEGPRPQVSGPGVPPLVDPEPGDPDPGPGPGDPGPGGPSGPDGPGEPQPQPTYPPRDGTNTPDPGGSPGPDPGPDPGPGPGPGPSPEPPPKPDDGGLPGNSENNPHGGPPGITGIHPWPDGNPGGHVPGTGNGHRDGRSSTATLRHAHKH